MPLRVEMASFDCITARQISGHQQSWGYEDGPWKGPGPPLLVAADFLKRITEEPFKSSPAKPVGYELSQPQKLEQSRIYLRYKSSFLRRQESRKFGAE